MISGEIRPVLDYINSWPQIAQEVQSSADQVRQFPHLFPRDASSGTKRESPQTSQLLEAGKPVWGVGKYRVQGRPDSELDSLATYTLHHLARDGR